MKPTKLGIWTIYATVAVYSMAYMAQVPLLPYLLQELGATGSSTYGRLATVFSLAQLLGGLTAGPLVDRWGGRALMVLSLMSSGLSYALTASATSLAGIYLSRAPTVMQHAILAARTYVAATAPPEDRARLIGLVGVAYGVGFAIGPALGGLLSQLGLRATAWAATGASVLSVLAVVMLVPGGHDRPSSASRTAAHQAPEDQGKAQEPATAAAAGAAEQAGTGKPATTQRHSWLQPLQVLRYPAVRQLMMIKLATGLAGALLQSVFTLMLQTQYGLSSKDNGMVLSYVGVLTMVSQAALVEPARRRLGEGGAVHASCALLAVSYLALAASRGSVWGLMAALLPSAAGGSVLSTINTAQLTQAAPADVTGSVLALEMSLFAAVRLFTPVLGTALLDVGGAALVGCTAAGLVTVLLVAMQLGLVKCDGGLPSKTAQGTQGAAKKQQ